MNSYVLYYNIEKSGFNAVFASLVLFFFCFHCLYVHSLPLITMQILLLYCLCCLATVRENHATDSRQSYTCIKFLVSLAGKSTPIKDYLMQTPLHVAMGRQLAQEKGIQTISVSSLTNTGYVLLMKFDKTIGNMYKNSISCRS